ncbi:hypothetical protein C1H76_1247 [Elsinoe australis]|uniref:Fucose-specific lectin n=1 Tax=Elsinoe australis TaxID=40998 RepID=A0A4U7BBH1_9PEZI|nr:hypothetical protein C1H76_1247 [Elsinoe australis]
MPPNSPYAHEEDRASTKEMYYGTDSKPPLVDSGLIPVRQPQDDIERNPQEQKIPAGNNGPEEAPEVVSYAPHYSSPTSPYPSQGYPPSQAPYGAPSEGGTAAPPKKSRTKRIVIIVGILLFIIIAAVLGGVLGTQLNKKSSDSNAGDNTGSNDGSQSPNSNTTTISTTPSTALQAIDRTGIATTARADGQGMLMYYQSSNGSVIETFFPNDALSSSSDTYRPSQSTILPISDIATGSPMSAISYTTNSTLYRQLFYARTDLRIMQTHTTNTTTSWSTPSQVSPQAPDQYLFSGSSGLCAVPFSFTSNGAFVGARVYYSQKSNWVQELFWDQARHGIDDVWTQGQNFLGAAAQSGTACGVTYGNGDAYTNVWYRNQSTGAVTHTYLTNNGRNGGWVDTQETALSNNNVFTPASGTAFEAVSDGAGNVQYLYYEGEDGNLKMVSSTAASPGSAEGTFLSFGPVSGGKIGAYFVGGSPLVVSQFNSSELRAQRIARQGSVLGNGTFVG